jgi:putative Holliday junction resolvase
MLSVSGARVVGLDLGRRRIGIAVSDPSGTLATPWRTVSGAGSADVVTGRIAASLAELAQDDVPVARVVVGHPFHLDGRPHEEGARVTAVVRAIAERTGLPVTLQDERLTSVEAEQRLALRERDWRRRKARLDAAAAAIILQDYLDGRDREEGG